MKQGTGDKGQGTRDGKLRPSAIGHQPSAPIRPSSLVPRRNDGVALIMAVFGMMVLAALGLVMASMYGTTTAAARGNYRVTQAFFIGDAGFSRGKEIMDDNPSWRPSAGNCAAVGMTHGTLSGQSYCRQTMTVGVSPYTVSGHFDLFVDDLGGGDVELRIRSAMDVSED